ncbi:MAG TPA: MFS transporter [Patescibacteria group bacterium]|nr:MFS transporter [Gammaproteobacteria bacterium]HWA51494.1 MFS transporter [Patescibacteria group bacterium]
MKDSMRITLVILGQFISQLGSSLTGFAFGIILFQMNNKVTDLSMLYFFQVLPVLLILLPAGLIVDKYSKKKFIILSEAISVLTLSYLIFKVSNHNLTKTDLYAYVAICSTFGTLQGLATITLVGINVSANKRMKFNTLLNLRQVVPRLIAPLFAGFWLMHGSTSVLFMLDIASSLFSIVMTLYIKDQFVPSVIQPWSKFLAEYIECIRELLDKPQLLWSLSCLMLSLCAINLIGVYILPISLLETSPEIAGKVIAMGGIGAVLAGVLVAFFPPKKLSFEKFIPLSVAFQGIILLLGSFSFHIVIMGLVLFIYFFISPWQRGCSYALWENSLENERYGKLLAIKGIMLQATSALVFLVAGPLVDKIVFPLLQQESHDTQSLFTLVYGTSNTGAMIFILTTIGLIELIFGLYVYLRKYLTNIIYVSN